MFATLLAFAFCAQAAAPALDVQGHRGARARYPENTIPAFEHALKAGVNTLELDLGVTKDSILVISHDQFMSLKICQHGDGKPIDSPILIHELTLKEVKTFDCGTLKHPDFPKQTPVPGTRVPTLREFFKWIKAHKLPRAKKVRFNIETKINPKYPDYTVGPQEFVKLVHKEIRRARMSKRVIIQSFDPRTLVEMKKLAPRIRTALLTDDPKLDPFEALPKARADIFSPRYNLVTPELVKNLRAKGYSVISWTPNTPETWQPLIDAKVDGIITDDPESLIQYLAEDR